MKVYELLNKINEISPLDLACPWDNCGLLLGDKNADVSAVYVTLDADMYALNKAVLLGCNVVVSHHPVIFDPLKSVTDDTVAYHYLNKGVAVISIHTCLDAVSGGVNDLFANCCALKDANPYYVDGVALARVGTVDCDDIDSYIEKVKTSVKSDRADCLIKRPVNKVMTVSGSGGSCVYDTYVSGCDTLITGEAKHDAFVLADNLGINLFAFGHFETENVVVQPLCKKLSDYVTAYPSDRTEFIKRR